MLTFLTGQAPKKMVGIDYAELQNIGMISTKEGGSVLFNDE